MKRKLKVAAIGTAWAAQEPLPALASHPLVELTAICSAQIDRARVTATRFGAALAFDDYERMYKEADCDLVYVGGPVALHHPMVMAAAALGKHIICEKPLAVTTAESEAMLAAMKAHNLAHLVAFTMRWFPGPHHIKRLIDEGVVGGIRHINIAFWFSLPPQVPRTYGWMNDLARGGGMLNAMGSHYIDLVRWWAGEFAAVSGITRHWHDQLPDAAGVLHEVTADDSFALLGRLHNGAIVSLHMSSEAPPGSGSRVELYGTEGSIVLDSLEGLQVMRKGATEPQAVKIPPVTFSKSAAQCQSPRFGALITRLARWIGTGKPESPNFEDALSCQRVMEAVRQAERERREIEI